jgi:clan AA aspartic protease (TIGR02281 family)
VYFGRAMMTAYQLCRIAFTTSIACLAAITVTQADQPTLWSQDGAEFHLIKKGNDREFRYKNPSIEVAQASAGGSALLFSGRSDNHHYSGTAFFYSNRCGRLGYAVYGPILDRHEMVRLKGQKPRLDRDCNIIDHSEITLEFRFVKNPSDTVVPGFRKSPVGSADSLSAPLKREGGAFLVPVLINKAISLDFVVDSGAGDVTIPQDVFRTLIRTGTIQESDLTGTRTYRLANGTTEALPTFKIRSLTLAGTAIEDVSGSVTAVEGSLLLGQSFLRRFKSWSIDNVKEALILEPFDGQGRSVLEASNSDLPEETSLPYEYGVLKNLNLRELPNPDSANLLSRWAPEDFVPKGTSFSEKPRCENGPTGYIWCRVTYTHHNTRTSGWVAGYYLWSAREKRRVACLYPSPDPDCRQ